MLNQRLNQKNFIRILTFIVVASPCLFGPLNSAFSQQKSRSVSLIPPSQIAQGKSSPSNEVKQSSSSGQDYPITISRKSGEDQIVHDEAYLIKKIDGIESHIQAIDKKVEYINSDPERKEKAESEGWFMQMSGTRSKLISEKQGLLNQLKLLQE